MKSGIHPNMSWYPCAAPAGISGKRAPQCLEKSVWIFCSECHPFFTGKQKLVDTAGRVERFRKKYAKGKSRRPTG